MVYFLIFLTVFMHLVLPVAFIFWLYNARPEGKIFFFSIALLTASYLTFMWLFGAGWGWVGVFWPPVFGLIFTTVLFLRIKRGLPAGWGSDKRLKIYFSTGLNLILTAIFLFTTLNYFSARDFEGEAMALEFPLVNGTFLIGQGGVGSTINQHFTVKAQRYALDIGELNAFGFRAAGLVPDEPESYQIFGNDIVAPCSGEVIATRADLEDQNAMVFDPENLLGNHIILFCGGNSILLAHLKHESVLVVVGDLVNAGQLIAQVGNTGNTSEPHLHIHVVRGRHTEKMDIASTQEPVPMTFGGKFLIRNDKVDN